MQGYRDLPDDFRSRYESIWITPPNDDRCDSATVGKYLHWNLDELELAPSLSAEDFARLIPRAGVRLIDGAGHVPQVEQRDEVSKLVLEFLA